MSAFNAPRTLNDPVGCARSSLSQTSAPVADDSQFERTSGVCVRNGAMRRAAASTSVMLTAYEDMLSTMIVCVDAGSRGRRTAVHEERLHRRVRDDARGGDRRSR